MTGTATAVALGWGVLVVARLWPHRPRRPHPGAPPVRPGQRRAGGGPSCATGAAVLGLVARTGPTGRSLAARTEPSRLGRAVLAAAATAPVVGPVAACAVGVLVWGQPALAHRRAAQRRGDAIRRQLPEAVDLLALAIGAGMTVPLAIAAVARRADGPVAEVLGSAVADAAAGRRLADSLDDVPTHLGEEVRPLVAALTASLRDGSPLAVGLERLAYELRADRRRRAEAAARQVPVKLLFPLVSCILPAFALLTVAPLLAGALQALRP